MLYGVFLSDVAVLSRLETKLILVAATVSEELSQSAASHLN